MKTVAKVLTVILGIMMIAAGVFCLFQPELTSTIMGYAVGLSLIFDAVGGFIAWYSAKKAGYPAGWMLASAILSAVFGFFILNNVVLQGFVNLFIITYFAVWLLCHGILDIILAFRVRAMNKAIAGRSAGLPWGIILILGILTVVFGVLCLMQPVLSASIIGIFIGLGVIGTGANLITLATMPETAPEN